MIKEAQLPSEQKKNNVSGIVSFFPDEIFDLALRTRFKTSGFGSLSFSNKQVIGDKNLQLELVRLAQLRKMEEKIAGKNGGDSGTVVLKPLTNGEKELETKVKAVGINSLLPVLSLGQEVGRMIQQVNILPNASSDPEKLNGAHIKFDPDSDWLKYVDITKLGPLGRGLMIIPLPPSFDEGWLIEHEKEALNSLLKFGKSKRRIKYIQILQESESGELLLALAAGPSLSDRRALREEVARVRSQKGRSIALHSLFNANQQAQMDMRRETAGEILELLGINNPSVEEVVNVPYVWLDPEQGIFSSGGISNTENEAPFTVGARHIILHDSVGFFPIGTGASSIKHDVLLPDGVSPSNLDAPNREIPDFIIPPAKGLMDVIALCFHNGWKMSTD